MVLHSSDSLRKNQISLVRLEFTTNKTLLGNSAPSIAEPEHIRAKDGLKYFAQNAGLFHITPIRTNSDFDKQRNFEGVNVFHMFPDERLHQIDFALRHFEDKLVVDLQRHPRLHSALPD